jgi:beta-glucanase (GH16 family)
MQDNGEVAIYTDPILYPQTNPYRIIDGKRALVAEKLPEPVSYTINNKVKRPTHSAPIVTTERMPRFGYGRFSYKFALPEPTVGMWPAGWQLALPHWRWPDPEHDTVEISFKTEDESKVLPYQTHWWGRPGKRGMKQGQFVDVHSLFPNFTYADQHEYWCDWTPEVMRWGIDDVLTFSAPNRYFLKDPASPQDPNRLFMILQIAVGGAGGKAEEGRYPSPMIVDHMAHYAMPVD